MEARVEDKLRELEAYEHIRRLAADYCHGFDKRDRDRFLSVWHEDASWQVMPDTEWLQGREAILAALAATWDGVKESHHWMCNHSIQVTGDSATGLIDADCVIQTPDGKWFRVAAAYHDVYERRDDVWAIARRGIDIFHNVAIAEPSPSS
jgi:uncharacterized protein (TIGR02246 family)